MKIRFTPSRLVIALLLTLPLNSYCTNTIVATKTDLTNKIASAKPGDTVTVKNGTYNWGSIILNNTKGTISSKWIVLQAETFNGVQFIGSTYLCFGGTRLLISGFKFVNGNAGTNDVIQFRGGTGATSPRAFYCRLTNITIDNYNSDSTGYSLPTPTDTKNRWVALFGSNNRIDHCTFLNKNNGAPTIAVMYDSANYPIGGLSTYHLIDSNYFKGRGWQGGNEGETIRVGLGSMSASDGYNVVEYNLFQDGKSSDPEIISNKSNRNTYRYNTFLNYDGGITLRQGRYCTVHSNFFIKTTNSKTSTSQYGVRVIDKGHSIYNNYFEALNANDGKLNTMPCPIVLYSGYSNTDSLVVPIPRYYSADSAIVAFNSILNCYGGAGIQIGFNADNAAPFKPKGIVIANNLIKMLNGQAVAVDTAAAGGQTVGFSAEGNLYKAPSGLGNAPTAGFTSNNISLTTKKYGAFIPPNVVKDAAVNSATYSPLLNGTDLFGFSRTSIFDVGAIELNATGTIINSPLDSTQVGAGMPIIILPVILHSFTGTRNNQTVALQWRVTATDEIDHFEIATSADGLIFNNENTVAVASKLQYQWTTLAAAREKVYYRLAIYTKSGKRIYAKPILLATTANEASVQIFPNPTKSTLGIFVSGISSPIEANIIDFTGKAVRRIYLQNGYNAFTLTSLVAGSYQVLIPSSQGISRHLPFVVAQ